MNTEKVTPVEHEKVNILMTIENGKVISSRQVREDEFTASMDTFFWMAKRAGYQVIPPAENNKGQTE